MQMNISTDYAIQIIIHLAKCGRIVSSKRLAKAIKISPRYLLQINAKLRDAGLIVVTHGSNGGAKLAKCSSEISLYDIIVLMEGAIYSRQQTSSDQKEIDAIVFLNTAYEYVDGLLEQSLRSITIESLLSQTEEQWLSSQSNRC